MTRVNLKIKKALQNNNKAKITINYRNNLVQWKRSAEERNP